MTRLREVFQQASNPMALLWGEDYRIEMANPAYLALLGVQDIEGMPLLATLPDEVRPRVAANLDRVLRTGVAHVGHEVPVMRTRSQDRMATPRIVDFVYDPICDHTGKVAGIFVNVNDVTARVHTRELAEQQRRAGEQALRDSEEMFRLAIRGARMGAWARDMAGDIVRWSADLESVFGLPSGSFGGSEEAFMELVHPDDRQRVMSAVRRALSSGSDYQVEFRFRHASGEWRWMEGRGRAVYDVAGTPVRLYGIGIDVTDRRRSELRLSRLFETNLLGVLYFDIGGGVQDANGEFLRIVGHDREDLEAQRIDWARMTPPEFQEQDGRAVAELRRNGSHPPIEKQYLRKDGSRIWVLVGSAMLDHSSGVGFVLDVSVLKQADAALREADRRKDEFLATLGHELRNPLAPIRNAAQLLARLQISDPQVQRIAQIIDRQVRHMVHLVDDLLDVSRITLGHISLRLEDIRLGDLLEDALDAVRTAVETAGHRLELDIQGGDCVLSGDATRLSQVFQNILNNAVKYTPRGGTITLRATVDDTLARVRIRDTGVGIPADMQARIFELFTRAHPEEELKTSGLGIGLALARQLVSLHGGTLTVDSAGTGHGSEFIVELPVRRLAG